MRRFSVLVVTFALLVALTPAATSAHSGRHDRALERYAADTWRSFDKLVDERTGLPADYIGGSLLPASRAAFTSPTNIAMYLWAALAARDLRLIDNREATNRIDTTLTSIERLERHEPSGQFYNWYDPTTLAKITIWPENGNPVYPFLSSVDNGWLASALLMVANAVPKFRHRAGALARSMDFGCYYDPLAKGTGTPGLIRGGFWRADGVPPGSDAFPRADYCGMGETVVYTGHHYGAFNTEPRIASDIGIALGQIPMEHYFAPWRTFPDTCDWSWSETKPVGEWRTYMGVDVFEGAYRYDDQLVVPTWGGSMFEALMPALVVPEQEWGRRSWAVTHPLFVESQIEFGLEEAGYGYWGFSPSSDPAGGYREYGVDAIGMEPNGYTADAQRLTLEDDGWNDPACLRPPTTISAYGDGVVTPHAAFLALEIAPEASLANLSNLKADFPGLYGRGGFKDSVNVATGQIADRYLALDQGMVIAAIANELLGGRFRDYLAVTLRPSLEPLMAMEEFGAGRAGS
ncbi:MAG TPA: glucoamylase family protein [Ilumatobacteraceae bacterium]|nr:glucoamylase family protein [Ilumatobacteraceae bacterium]